ncbi:hypothetical protein EYF80_013945 [Liparis tanakae]|uniref:Uncharacterized protein n=1 Tax=Liparis tanakae TaxID=230148 RepID=A0A4Z2ICU3_9TELE|nr:hypothetical protein EYF80_013945 [Liparis tanakae]
MSLTRITRPAQNTTSPSPRDWELLVAWRRELKSEDRKDSDDKDEVAGNIVAAVHRVSRLHCNILRTRAKLSCLTSEPPADRRSDHKKTLSGRFDRSSVVFVLNAELQDLQTTLEGLFQSIEPAGQTTNSHMRLAVELFLNRVHLENTEDRVWAGKDTGGKDQEGEERGGMQEREVTEECGTKGHPLTAAHSVTARPR